MQFHNKYYIQVGNQQRWRTFACCAFELLPDSHRLGREDELPWNQVRMKS